MPNRILPITTLPAGAIPPAVLVCGDPARATQAASFLDKAELLSDKREYRAYRGTYRDVLVAVCSHGVGAPGAAIAFEELIAAGAQRIIRIGTCGSLQPGVGSGHLVIATAAVQNTGYGRETIPDGYPAVADVDLTLALRKATEATGRPFTTGIVLSRDAFYAGVPTPAVPDYQVLSAARVVAVEMECAALFIVGNLRGVQTAAILAVDGNVLDSGESIDTYDPGQAVVAEAVTAEIHIALYALLSVER